MPRVWGLELRVYVQGQGMWEFPYIGDPNIDP